ncbi:hypothetical protein M9458_001741, partial [Cirrhinus mrigala]
MFLESTTGSREARRLGTRHIITYNTQSDNRRNKLTGIATLARNIPLASEYGYPPETSVSICHVASSVP